MWSQEDSPIVTCVLWEAPSVKWHRAFLFPQLNHVFFFGLIMQLLASWFPEKTPIGYARSLLKLSDEMRDLSSSATGSAWYAWYNQYRNTWWHGFTVIFITYSVLVTDSSNIYVAPFSKNTIQIFRNKFFLFRYPYTCRRRSVNKKQRVKRTF